MKKKKVLVHGTQDSLQKFFSDAVSRDFEIVAVLSKEKISVELDNKELEILTPQSLPKFVYRLVDGIILTDARGAVVKFFLKQNIAPHKIILWDEQQGWGYVPLPEKDGTQVIYFCGLEFHIRDKESAQLFEETFWRLLLNHRFKNIPPQMYPAVLAQEYQQRMGRPLDLNNPKTFTEKLQWLKIFDATPLKSRLADKYLVRRWVAEKIGEQYLIPLLGVWDNFDDINFDDLPDRFVLKCNHGSGMNVIVRDKKNFDRQRAREKLNAWLAFDYGIQIGLELHYTRIDRKIIAEKYITDMGDGVIDYKFHCFNGEPKFIQVIGDRDFVKHTRYQKFCDLKYNDIGAMFEDYPHFPYDVPKPKNFELMKKIAATLAEGFAYVRVDFYEIDDKVLFGEMTFTSDSGYLPHKKTWTYEKDYEVGSLLKLPEPTLPPEL
ncbi:MAG: hypothetical protein IKI08_04815 [Selenomonadaceae bacterium]|nr:hypothetical protein [Selenomonadaceae bacterium]